MGKAGDAQRFLRFFPWSRRLSQLSRRLTVAGVGALSLGGVAPALHASSASGAPPAGAQIVLPNRERRTSPAKLVLRLSNTGWLQLAQHRSHSSHSSHSSHASHGSHYSSSTRPPSLPPAPSSPSPAPAPPSAIRPAEPAPPTGDLLAQRGVEQTRITIERIDFVKDTVSGKNREGSEQEFYYERDTRIRRSRSDPTGRPLLEILEESGPNFPLRRGQEILVSWTPHPELPGKKLAVRIDVEPLR